MEFCQSLDLQALIINTFTIHFKDKIMKLRIKHSFKSFKKCPCFCLFRIEFPNFIPHLTQSILDHKAFGN